MNNGLDVFCALIMIILLDERVYFIECVYQGLMIVCFMLMEAMTFVVYLFYIA